MYQEPFRGAWRAGLIASIFIELLPSMQKRAGINPTTRTQRAVSPSSSSATTLLPGQDNPAPSVSMSGVSWFVVSCGVRLSEVGVEAIPKPRVTVDSILAPIWCQNTLTHHDSRARTTSVVLTIHCVET